MDLDIFAQYILNKYDNGKALVEEDIEALVWDYEYDRIEGENRRWSRWVDVIVRLGNRYFKIGYDEGLTEMQPNDYSWTDIEEVVQVEKTIVVKEWVKKND